MRFLAWPRNFRRTSPRCVGAIFLALCLTSALASVCFAQTPGGSIVGKVFEKHGGPLAGARVSVSNIKTGVASSVATDVNGQFMVENLRPGAYKVSISADGCVPQEEKVTVKPGHTSKLSSTLKPVAQQTSAPQ